MIRRATSDADLSAYAAIWGAARPHEPISGVEVSRRFAQQPERHYLLAEQDGSAVGCGFVFAFNPEVPRRFVVAPCVVPESRHRGIGSAVLEACIDHARVLGADTLISTVWADDGDAVRFAERRGFAELDRMVSLVRELADEQPLEPRDGVEITELREEHYEDAYAVDCEAAQDIPDPEPAWPFDRWLKAILASKATFVALEAGRVVGLANLEVRDEEAGLLEHGFTAVLRSHRRRGIAEALKRTEIAWAAEQGFRRLLTSNHEANRSMQALNEKLGYRPLPALIRVRRVL